MGMGSQHHAPAALPSRKRPSMPEWATAGLDGAQNPKILPPRGFDPAVCPAHNGLQYCLRYPPAHTCNGVALKSFWEHITIN